MEAIRRLGANIFSRSYASAPTPTPSAITLLKSQPSHYVVAQLHQRLYLLTANDILTVPWIPDLKVGEKIRLSRILQVGSRDYTLRVPNTKSTASGNDQPERAVLSEQDVQVWATIIEHTKSKIQHIEKFKRRHRYHRLLHHKGQWTRLKINEIRVGQVVPNVAGSEQGVTEHAVLLENTVQRAAPSES